MSVRVRYAPSPTGDPHLGILRTAVFDYLFARAEDGVFILRLEDTDQKREKEGSVDAILHSLHWLGINPDEGLCLDEAGKTVQRGHFGPYIQSERLEIYRKQAEWLVENGKAYYCFCSPERLEQVRNEQQANHQAPRYDRHCRAIGLEEARKRVEAGERHVVRQLMPDGRTVAFTDLVRGEISFQSSDLDDQVLLKSDGFPTYQLANVVDDHLMEISHVFRGEEWIPSTPKNLLLYEAFGWQPPQFAHMPVILGPDKKHKLSKRDGAEPVLTYRDRGYLPEAVLNFLAFLGWSPGTEEEFFTLEELVKRFRLDRVQKAPAIFNPERLDYVNGWYIRQQSLGEVAEMMIPYLEKENLIKKEGEKYQLVHELNLENPNAGEYLLAVANAVRQRLKRYDETVEASWFFFKRPAINDELKALIVPKKGDFQTTKNTLVEVVGQLDSGQIKAWTVDGIESFLREFIEKSGYNSMQVLWPLRAALSGVAASPGAFEMLAVLGKEEALFRLKGLLES